MCRNTENKNKNGEFKLIKIIEEENMKKIDLKMQKVNKFKKIK